MKKRLVVFRALPKYRDARTVRYLLTEGYNEVLLNTWEDVNNDKGLFTFLKIDRSRVSKKITYPLYLLYLLLHSLFVIRWNDDVICMDLDTFIPIYLGSFFKKGKVYLDIVDPIAETKFQSLPFRNVFDYIEIFFLKYRKYNILPNENRIQYYKEKYGVSVKKFRYTIIENVPLLSGHVQKKEIQKNALVIGYFGTLEQTRGILELIDFVKQEQCKLLIAGDGKIKNDILQKIIDTDNIEYLGKYNYNEIENLYKKVDFVWAYYNPNVFLHKFATPNKYYEHLAFSTPIIINKIVPQSQHVREANSGIVIDDMLKEESWENLLKEIKTFNYLEADFSQWDKKYKNYRIKLI